ncbi:hypothetical protein [Vibrio chagasii]|uniref:hypothetical protein n=1 Tax=Vibrio chagasii TaxID=170679 RepID=UPI0014768E38|nr:hypothetical protein [Vibrio chagasii]
MKQPLGCVGVIPSARTVTWAQPQFIATVVGFGLGFGFGFGFGFGLGFGNVSTSGAGGAVEPVSDPLVNFPVESSKPMAPM